MHRAMLLRGEVRAAEGGDRLPEEVAEVGDLTTRMQRFASSWWEIFMPENARWPRACEMPCPIPRTRASDKVVAQAVAADHEVR